MTKYQYVTLDYIVTVLSFCKVAKGKLSLRKLNSLFLAIYTIIIYLFM